MVLVAKKIAAAKMTTIKGTTKKGEVTSIVRVPRCKSTKKEAPFPEPLKLAFVGCYSFGPPLG